MRGRGNPLPLFKGRNTGMRIFTPCGQESTCNLEQLEVLQEAGWSREKPKSKKVEAKKPEAKKLEPKKPEPLKVEDPPKKTRKKKTTKAE
jgi:hypothetical protein